MNARLVAAALLAIAAGLMYRRELDASGLPIGGAIDAIDNLSEEIMRGVTGYTPAKVPEAYREAIDSAEQANGIPQGMLARLLWQESRYRPEIIDGRVKSPTGAMGIAQFMPATAREWGVDALNPESAIAGAGRYLAWLYKRTGSWQLALAAYNWGIGNVLRKGIASAPTETKNYFSQILADIGLGGSTA